MQQPLILIPTELELQRLGWSPKANPPVDCHVEVVGFGIAGATAMTSWLLNQLKPSAVLLLGIAGALTDDLQIGEAYTFSTVGIDGIGVWRNGEFVGPSSLKMPQIPKRTNFGQTHTEFGKLETANSMLPANQRSHQHVPSATLLQNDGDTCLLAQAQNVKCGNELLTVCASSSDLNQASERARRFPRATAEDMEGFGVALACGLHGIPCSVIRGISNRAGDSNVAHWSIDSALHAANHAAQTWIEQQVQLGSLESPGADA